MTVWEHLQKRVTHEWQWTRVITTPHYNATGQGSAWFKRFDLNSMLYVEEGTLTTPHGTVHARQQYRYQKESTGLSIWFCPPRQGLFVNLVFKGNTASARHVCGADVYTVTLRWDQDALYTHHQIIGRNKNDVITTVLTPLGSLRHTLNTPHPVPLSLLEGAG
jgi:Family of unknown function (DUF6314)